MRKLAHTKSGLILMISLWILALVSLLSLGLAHRVSVNLKLVKFQKDKMKCLYIAKAGILKAVSVLGSDSIPETDTLNELWSRGYAKEIEGGSYIFKDISVGDGIFTISYIFDDTNSQSLIYFYGLSDEERKIDINTADKNLLIYLFDVIGESDSESLADAIIYWRGDNPLAEDPYYNSLEIPYSARKAHFKTIEELSLVKGFRGNWDLIERCSIFFTVYTGGLININTVQKQVLKSIFMGLGAENITVGFSDRLVNNVINFRDGDDNEQATDDDVAITYDKITTVLKTGLVNPLEITWIDSQNFPFTVSSNLFRIEVLAKLNTGMAQKKITAVISRNTGLRVKYWHEE
jgi:type II secretory pathway component PulK